MFQFIYKKTKNKRQIQKINIFNKTIINLYNLTVNTSLE